MAWFAGLSSTSGILLVIMAALTVGLLRARLHPLTFAVISWPGTVAHETAHFIVGLLLGAKPTGFSLLPSKNPDGSWTLGYVSFSNTRWWNTPWTAMAPMLLAPLAIYLVPEWVTPTLEEGDFLGAAWRLAICVVTFQASWPSDTDFELALPGFFVFGVIAYLLW